MNQHTNQSNVQAVHQFNQSNIQRMNECVEWDPPHHSTRRTTTRSSKVNSPPQKINFRALCGATLVTSPSNVGVPKTFVVHRVAGEGAHRAVGTTNQSTNQSIDQPTNQPTNQPIKRSMIHSQNQSTRRGGPPRGRDATVVFKTLTRCRYRGGHTRVLQSTNPPINQTPTQ